jgi:hypothetical protein
VSRTHHARKPRRDRSTARTVDLVTLADRHNAFERLRGECCMRGMGGIPDEAAIEYTAAILPPRHGSPQMLAFRDRRSRGIWFVGVVASNRPPNGPFLVGFASEAKCQREGL